MSISGLSHLLSSKSIKYDRCKKELAAEFSDNRNGYTAGKQELIRLFAARGPHLASGAKGSKGK